MSTAIFYASSTGNSDEVASKISSALGEIEVFNLANTKVDKINEYDKVILGGSTWGDGELNDGGKQDPGNHYIPESVQ
mgnify:CR=1 FL=1